MAQKRIRPSFRKFVEFIPLPSHSLWKFLFFSVIWLQVSTAIASSFLNQAASGTAAQQDPANGPTELYKIGSDISAPVLLYSVEPEWPRDTLKDVRDAIGVATLVRGIVEIDGKLRNTSVLRTTYFDYRGHLITTTIEPGILERLQRASLEAAKHYKFKPAKKGGNPVRVELNTQIIFQAH